MGYITLLFVNFMQDKILHEAGSLCGSMASRALRKKTFYFI